MKAYDIKQKEALADNLKGLFHRVTGIDVSHIQGETNLMENVAIASIEMVQIIALIEQEYGIQIDEVRIMLVETFDDLLDLILSSGGNR